MTFRAVDHNRIFTYNFTNEFICYILYYTTRIYDLLELYVSIGMQQIVKQYRNYKLN